MDIIHFFIRYTPFWAVPIIMICAEFAYIYWMKTFKKVSIVLVFIGFISFLGIIYYYIAGGPDGSVRTFIDLCEYLSTF